MSDLREEASDRTRRNMKFVPKDHVFEVPTSLAVCPYCNAKLYASCEAWTENDEGEWQADEITVDCDSEPDIDSPKWEEWLDFHGLLCLMFISYQ